jgi:FkbM family methyltransferase
MACLKSDEILGPALDLYGEFAESENRVMLSLVSAGDTVVDVGASVGTVTLALANRVGPSGLVLAFEPQRIIHQLLSTALTLNGLLNVRVCAMALGASTGFSRIPDLNPESPGNSGAVTLGAASGDLVPVVPLDSFELPTCRLVKIDVEGMDYQVLLGAESTVSRHLPHIYVEAKKGPATRNAIAWLLERGYRCHWHFAEFFSPNNYNCSSENVFGGRGDINLLAISPRHGGEVNLPLVASPDADWQHDYGVFLSKNLKE